MEIHRVEDGLNVIYVDGARYEETAERDDEGRAVFAYTGYMTDDGITRS